MFVARVFLAVFILANVNTASAVVTTYTDAGMFETAVGAGALTTVNFEGITTDANLVLSDGDSTTIPGLTFTYGALDPDTLVITDGSDFGTNPTTTSEAYYLGTNAAGAGDYFESNDSFTVTFDTNVTAVGMFVIVPDDGFGGGFFDPDEVTLTFGGGSVGNTITPDVAPDGTSSYFLGIQDTAGTFNSFTLTGNVPAFGSDFGVDDIRFAPVAVPEPTSFALLCVVGVGFSVNRRRRRM